MSSSSPPKPWETQGTTPNIPTAMPITTAGAPPPLPERNLAMTDPTNTREFDRYSPSFQRTDDKDNVNVNDTITQKEGMALDHLK